jgi:tetratricopeptide (TPR) repeat protein
LWKKLGAFGSDLAMLANFFDPPWSRPVASLSEADRSWLLGEAGIILCALGRLPEAVEPMEAGLDDATASHDWENAGIRARNLSGLHLTLGHVTSGVGFARRSVDYADRSGDAFDRLVNRTALADSLHQSGKTGDAVDLFREAEQMQKDRQPDYPLLYALQGYWYCDFLLAQGERAEVRRRAAQTVKWAEAHRASLLDIALQRLSLGRALPPDSQEASTYLDHAVDGLREAGQQDDLPRGLLARAALRRHRRDYPAAQRDLDEASALSTRCGMRLHLTDCHLEFARLHLAQNRPAEARTHLEEARRLVEETGYHRRDLEVAELDRQLP